MQAARTHACQFFGLCLVAVVLAVSSGAPSSAQAPPSHEGPGPRNGGGRPHGPPGLSPDRALEEIELPDDVRAEVDKVLDDAQVQRRTLERSLRTAHDRMRALLEAPEPDEAVVLAQADEIGRLRTELDKTRLSTLLKINRLLSPEQRDALTLALEEPRKRRRPPEPPALEQ